jgi:hypothetical protein
MRMARASVSSGNCFLKRAMSCGGGLRGRVDGVVGEMNVEGAAFVLLDEGHGFLGEARGQVALVLDRLAVPVDRRAFDVVELEVVVRAAAEETIPFVEAAADGALLDGEAEMPLAEGAAHVAGGFQEFWENGFRLRDAAPAFTGGVDAGALLIAPGEQAGAGGGAHVAGDVGLGEPHALARQGVEVGRGDLLRMVRVEADVGVALVVGEDDDDVGRAWRGGGHRVFLGKTTRHGKTYYTSNYYVKIQHAGRRELLGLNTADKEEAMKAGGGGILPHPIRARRLADGHRQVPQENGRAQRRSDRRRLPEGGERTVWHAAADLCGLRSEAAPRRGAILVSEHKRLANRYDAKKNGRKKWIEEVEKIPLRALTDEAIRRWQVAYVAARGNDPVKVKMAKHTVDSNLRSCKSLFAPRIVKWTKHLRLPDPLPFRNLDADDERAEFLPLPLPNQPKIRS